MTAAPADKPWMTEKDKNQLLFCLHTFTFTMTGACLPPYYRDWMRQGDVDQSLPWTAERDKKSPLCCLHTFTFTPEGGACLRSHYANDPKWSVFYLLSYTSVPMTGSNFGNFFNEALKDFEAKQASRIRVCVWEFPWVIFLRNVLCVNSDYDFKF